jgi:cell division protein FtsB
MNKIQFVTYLVYLILGFILGFLIRHLFGKLNISKKLRDRKLTEEIEALRKRASDLEEENKRLRNE